MSRPVVIVMVKAPRAGFVKTRLSSALSEEDAATLAVCFVQDVVKSVGQITDDLIIAYAPSDGRATLEAILKQKRLLWFEQRGANLGERLEQIAAQAFDMGFSPLIFIGTDSPTLPTEFINEGIQSLASNESDIALGPTEDGGYYLVGLRQPAPGIFQNIAWSTSETFAQTARNAKRLNLRLLELPLWYDVDTYADLLRLRNEIFSNNHAQQRANTTYQWLSERMRDEG